MTKVLFNQTRTVQDENRMNADEQITYEAGKVYDLPQNSVDRWIKRGVATADKNLIKQAEEKQNKVKLELEDDKDEEEETETFTKTSSTILPAKTSETETKNETENKLENKFETKSNAPNAMTTKDMPGLTPTVTGNQNRK